MECKLPVCFIAPFYVLLVQKSGILSNLSWHKRYFQERDDFMWFIIDLICILSCGSRSTYSNYRISQFFDKKFFLEIFFCALSAVIAAPSDGKKHEQKDDAVPVEIKLPVKHVLSGSFRYIICYIHFQFIFNLLSCSLVIWPLLLSLQLYYDKITNLTMSRSDSVLFKQALVSLATDSGLHPLVPYFTYFIADEVKSFYYIIDMTDREIYSNLLLIPSVICPIILGISWFK